MELYSQVKEQEKDIIISIIENEIERQRSNNCDVEFDYEKCRYIFVDDRSWFNSTITGNIYELSANHSKE